MTTSACRSGDPGPRAAARRPMDGNSICGGTAASPTPGSGSASSAPSLGCAGASRPRNRALPAHAQPPESVGDGLNSNHPQPFRSCSRSTGRSQKGGGIRRRYRGDRAARGKGGEAARAIGYAKLTSGLELRMANAGVAGRSNSAFPTGRTLTETVGDLLGRLSLDSCRRGAFSRARWSHPRARRNPAKDSGISRRNWRVHLHQPDQAPDVLERPGGRGARLVRGERVVGSTAVIGEAREALHRCRPGARWRAVGVRG